MDRFGVTVWVWKLIDKLAMKYKNRLNPNPGSPDFFHITS
jgi:hypothetical protein